MKTIFLSLITFGVVVWSGMSDMVAERLSKAFGVTVKIGSLDLETTVTTISNLEFGNPPQYKRLNHAWTAAKTNIKAPWSKFLEKDVVIDEIEMNDVYLGFEFDSIKGTTGNWSQIMENLQKKTDDKEPGQTLLIRRLVLKNIQADVVFDDREKVHHLSETRQVVLTNISSETGLSMDQISRSELGKKLKAVFVKENANEMLKNFFENPAAPLEKIVPAPFKGVFQ